MNRQPCRRLALAAISLMFGLTACVSTGTQVKESALTQFHKGVTTEAQVEKALGPPQSTSLGADGTRSISYIYGHASPKAVDFVPIVGLFAGGAKTKSTTVTFHFDLQGRLVSYSANSTHADVQMTP